MNPTLTAVDLPNILDSFGRVYVIDTEFYSQPGLPDGPVVPVALQAYEVRSGSWVSVFFNEVDGSYENPLEPNALYITFNAAAEWNCFLSLDWPLPQNSIDLYVEFKNLVSGLKPPPQFRQRKFPNKWDSSLLGVVRRCGLPFRAVADKKAAIDLILRGHPYSAEERKTILNYCRHDVVDTVMVCKTLLPQIGNIPQAIFRAHFMRAAARIHRAGIPVDTEAYGSLVRHREHLKLDLVSQLVGAPMDIYEGTSLNYKKLEALVNSLGLQDNWPKPHRKRSKKRRENANARKNKVFSTEVESFEAMAVLRPELAPLGSIVKRMKDLKDFGLVIGTDGRSRYPLFPFDTITGRCTPPAKQFVLAQSSWTRGFVAPPPGWAISYLDYGAAEVLIAAVLSGDTNLLADYLDGDPYTNCAIRMGLAPQGSTIDTIGTLRDIMKVWLLSTLYGASPKSLHDGLPGSTLQQPEEFVLQNHTSYARYWRWSDLRTDIFLYETGLESTVFGWQHHLDSSDRFDDFLFSVARSRSRNFPMQATCQEILRWACTLASDDGITIHAPLHDAVLIGALDASIEDNVVRMRQHMITASRLVLGVDMKVPMPAIIRYPERMRVRRGAKEVWEKMMGMLANLDPEIIANRTQSLSA